MSIIPSFFGRRTGKLNSQEQEPMTVDIWDPLEGLSFAATALTTLSPIATTQMDWKETPDAHVFITDLPGVKKEDVNVEVEEEKILKICGQRSRASDEKGDKWHRVERRSEKFIRSVKLPQNTSAESVRAKLENGVLTVIVPKENDKKAQACRQFYKGMNKTRGQGSNCICAD